MTVSLYGRTDKLKRSGGTLGVEDDKFPAKTGPYLKRDAPYDNQLLQILAQIIHIPQKVRTGLT